MRVKIKLGAVSRVERELVKRRRGGFLTLEPHLRSDRVEPHSSRRLSVPCREVIRVENDVLDAALSQARSIADDEADSELPGERLTLSFLLDERSKE